jgi:hypothetical protein
MTDFAEEPLDDDDEALLDALAAIHARIDPPPADLDERVQFAIALLDVAAEVAQLGSEMLVGSGARGSERTRTITFDADSRTIMISIVDRPGGDLRVDGWLAPAARMKVELRYPEPEPTRIVTTDDTGRFVFDGVPHGLAQLLVHPPDGAAGPRVVTPSLAL